MCTVFFLCPYNRSVVVSAIKRDFGRLGLEASKDLQQDITDFPDETLDLYTNYDFCYISQTTHTQSETPKARTISNLNMAFERVVDDYLVNSDSSYWGTGHASTQHGPSPDIASRE